MSELNEAAINQQPTIVGYRCLNSQYNGVIPLSSYIDPCPHDLPVWSDGHIGPRDNGSSDPEDENE